MGEQTKIRMYEPAVAGFEQRHAELMKPYEPVDAEGGPDLRAYWRIIKKRRWTILSIVAILLTIGLIASIKQKPVYRTTTLLEIQKENPNILTVQELFQFEDVSDNYLETQYKVLQSETLARRVIDELHLDRLTEFNASRLYFWNVSQQNAGSGDSSSPDFLTMQRVLRRFEERLSIEPVRRSRLVRVSFESQDPQLAAKITNSLATNYIQGNLENRWESTQKASEWLSQQLQSIKSNLEKSEDDLQQYAEANGLLFLESDKGDTQNIIDERLRQLQEELTKAQADRYVKESLYRLVETGDFSSLSGVVDNRLMQDLTVRIADLERQKAELAPVFSDTYPKVKTIQSQIDRTEQLLTQERKRAADRFINDYNAAVRRESLVRQAFEEQRKQANLIAGRAVQYNILKREVDTNKQLYEGLLQRLKEAGVSAGLKASNIRIVDAAVPPTNPVKPRILLNLILALALGLSAGLATAFLKEHLDNTLKTPQDIENFLRLPALALIPSLASLAARKKAVYGMAVHRPSIAGPNGHSVTLDKKLQAGWIHIKGNGGTQDNVLSEAFRGLRTSVLLSTAGRPPRSLTFASAEPGEGKTTVACNLAMSLAQLGKRVLLIDADLRRPSVHKLLNIENRSVGVVTFLTGQEEWTSLIRATATRGLDSLLCGPVPPNPSELLSSDRMQVLIQEAMAEYNFVLLDSPPLLNVADGRILTTLVEGAILVVKAGSTPRELVHRAHLSVRDVGARLIGVILNNVDMRQGGYYGSYYRYHEYGGIENTMAES